MGPTDRIVIYHNTINIQYGVSSHDSHIIIDIIFKSVCVICKVYQTII